MPARNFPETLRSGARPCAPLDFGPTDPFGRLDCLLLPLLLISNTSTCGCAWSTRTDRRLSDQNDPLLGGDAPTKLWTISSAALRKRHNAYGKPAVLPWASRRLRIGTGPLVHSAPPPRRAIRWAHLTSVAVSPTRRSELARKPTAEPLVRTSCAAWTH
jgi:hypothetical protein